MTATWRHATLGFAVAATIGVAGIYGIAVRRAYQRQGLGRLATLVTAHAGAERGFTMAMLQATRDGFPARASDQTLVATADRLATASASVSKTSNTVSSRQSASRSSTRLDRWSRTIRPPCLVTIAWVAASSPSPVLAM